MEEVYEVIEGFEDYLVSDLGNVMNRDTEQILKGGYTKDGYRHVGLTEDGKRKTLRVHRLVAQAFIPNPENKTCVDHIDRVRTNNNVNNLRWATVQENSFNKSKSKRNISGHLGVSYHKGDRKWRARLKINGVPMSVNCDTIEEAVKVREEMANGIFKTFAPQPIININITNNTQTLDTLNEVQSQSQIKLWIILNYHETNK